MGILRKDGHKIGVIRSTVITGDMNCIKLFNEDDLAHDGYIDGNDGHFIPESTDNNNVTDYIDISLYDSILTFFQTAWSGRHYNGFYDSNKNYLGNTGDMIEGEWQTNTIPNGARYFRMSFGGNPDATVCYGMNDAPLLKPYKHQRIKDTDYEALTVKDPNTVYSIYYQHSSSYGRAYYKDVINGKWLSKWKTQEEIEDFDYYYEDIQSQCPIVNSSIVLARTTTNWRLVFNINPTYSGSENAFLGAGVSGVLELFTSSNHNGQLGFYGNLTHTSGSDYYDYTPNTEIVWEKINGTCNLYFDGVLIDTWTTSSNNGGNLVIGGYTGPSSYQFDGTINYVGYKELE